MKYDFGVTVATDLAIEELRTSEGFRYVSVLDLRQCNNAGPYPIDEQIFRRLRYCQIPFHQMPINLHNASSRQQNELYAWITNLGGRVFVIADQPELLSTFCESLDIPCSNCNEYHLIPANDEMPLKVVSVSRGI